MDPPAAEVGGELAQVLNDNAPIPFAPALPDTLPLTGTTVKPFEVG
jgi:hypothetical protein